MSWDSFIDSLITDSAGAISKATIIGLNGSIWTPKTNEKILAISQWEASKIGSTMSAKNDSIAEKFSADGVDVGGTEFMFIRDVCNDGRIMTAKHAAVGSLTLQSTSQAVVIALTPDKESHLFGNAITSVEAIAKYLESNGY